MNDERPHDRFGFAWDITMALRKVPLYLGRNRRMTLEDKHGLARQILTHLEQAGVRFTRRPPVEEHGQQPYRDNGGE